MNLCTVPFEQLIRGDSVIDGVCDCEESHVVISTRPGSTVTQYEETARVQERCDFFEHDPGYAPGVCKHKEGLYYCSCQQAVRAAALEAIQRLCGRLAALATKLGDKKGTETTG
jgi:hypothetical protein